MSEAKWYVVHTYSGYENAVKIAIEKAVVNRSMEDMVLQIEIPMETVTEFTDSGEKTVERKVFPGYVLCKMILTDTPRERITDSILSKSSGRLTLANSSIRK